GPRPYAGTVRAGAAGGAGTGVRDRLRRYPALGPAQVRRGVALPADAALAPRQAALRSEQSGRPAGAAGGAEVGWEARGPSRSPAAITVRFGIGRDCPFAAP